MAIKDYYEVLGVPRDANEDDIRKRFRKLAMEWHPDRNPDNPAAEEKFKEINEAYQILSDPEKRRKYDRFGHNAFSGESGPGHSPFHESDFADEMRRIFEGIERGHGGIFFVDPFEDLNLGRRPQNATPPRGSDTMIQVSLTLEEAASGVEKTIHFSQKKYCAPCKGSGAEKKKMCSTCRGSGEMNTSSSGGAFMRLSRTCVMCRGSGERIAIPCRKCQGSGSHTDPKSIAVKIPKGVDRDQLVKIQGEGNTDQIGQEAGHLYIQIEIEPHTLFKRSGDDIFAEQEISFIHAALGTEITLSGLDGKKYALKIPEGTQHGTSFVLRRKGIPHLEGSGQGDIYLTVKVRVPEKLNRKQKKLLRELQKTFEKEEQP